MAGLCSLKVWHDLLTQEKAKQDEELRLVHEDKEDLAAEPALIVLGRCWGLLLIIGRRRRIAWQRRNGSKGRRLIRSLGLRVNYHGSILVLWFGAVR